MLERLDRAVAEGAHGTGAQVYASRHGDVVADAAFGLSTVGPMRVDTLHNVWCGTKPIIAVELARLCEDASVPLSTPVVELTPSIPFVDQRRCTILELLDHTAGLVEPSAWDVRFRAPARWPDLLRQADRPRGFRPGIDAGYSEVAAWCALVKVVGVLAGAGGEQHVQTVVEGLGLHDTHLVVDDAVHDRIVGRIGCYVGGLPDEAVPLLQDRMRSVTTRTSPTLGGYTTMRDLGRYGQRRPDLSPPPRGRPRVPRRCDRHGRLVGARALVRRSLAVGRGLGPDGVGRVPSLGGAVQGHLAGGCRHGGAGRGPSRVAIGLSRGVGVGVSGACPRDEDGVRNHIGVRTRHGACAVLPPTDDADDGTVDHERATAVALARVSSSGAGRLGAHHRRRVIGAPGLVEGPAPLVSENTKEDLLEQAWRDAARRAAAPAEGDSPGSCCWGSGRDGHRRSGGRGKREDGDIVAL